MKVQLSTLKKQQYEVRNEAGLTIKLGNKPDGFSPMESVLAAAASCSSIDVEIILDKMKEKLDRIEVEVEGFRDEDAVPRVFTRIELKYMLYGSIKAEKAEKAVALSVEKYCSVLKMLDQTVDIDYSIELISK